MGGPQLLFIIAPHKTATSTLVGMLNCHPEIFILYETHLHETRITKYGSRFLEAYPEARYVFSSHYNNDLRRLYLELAEFLLEKGLNYKYVGDKFVGLNDKYLLETNNVKAIFTVRDIRTWLCKDYVIEKYFTSHDAVPAAIDYIIFFLKCFLREETLRLTFEEIVHENKKVIEKLGLFLDLDLSIHLDFWWEKISIADKNNANHILGWWQVGHDSAGIEPKYEDVRVELKEHRFWDNTLTIFDKYFHNIDNHFDKNEIENDIKLLQTFKKYSPVSLDDLYFFYENNKYVKIKESKKKYKGLKRIRKKMKKKTKKQLKASVWLKKVKMKRIYMFSLDWIKPAIRIGLFPAQPLAYARFSDRYPLCVTNDH